MTVRFLSVLVGPVKSDGCQWDGFTCGKPSGDVWDAISSLGGLNGVDAVLALYNAGVFDALNKPDPMGWIAYGTSGPVIEVPATQDVFLAPFRATFTGVPYHASMVFEGEVWDEDLINHDLVWAGTIRFREVERALISGEDYWVDLRSASQNQLIGMLISVVAE